MQTREKGLLSMRQHNGCAFIVRELFAVVVSTSFINVSVLLVGVCKVSMFSCYAVPPTCVVSNFQARAVGLTSEGSYDIRTRLGLAHMVRVASVIEHSRSMLSYCLGRSRDSLSMSA